MKKLWLFLLCLTLGMYGNMTRSSADEHPAENYQGAPATSSGTEKKMDGQEESHDKAEHPKKKKKSPKHKNQSWNKEGVEKDLMSFVKQESAKTNGIFSVYDEVQKMNRKLSLEKIHTDKIVQLTDGTSFVCSDFKDSNGDLVDVDFFMSSTDEGYVEKVRKVQIHKINGNARYTYVEKDGKWVQASTN